MNHTVDIAPRRSPDLEATLLHLFDRRLGLEVPSADANLLDSGILDSLVLVRLLAAIEERLGVRVGLERLEMSDFRSVSTIAGWLAEQAEGCAA